MHRTLSGWEYYILLKEAQPLLKNRLSKAYQTGPRQFRLDFAKFSLIIGVGEYFYVTKSPPAAPERPSQFAMLLRKHLGGKFLDSFRQYKNDRIYELEFSNSHRLVLEQFAQGNMFLLDEKGIILRPYSFAPTSKKAYRAGEKYEYPDSAKANLLKSPADWKRFAGENSKKSIGSALGRLSFGKIYTNSLLEKSRIPTGVPVPKITGAQAQKIMEGLVKMQESPRFLVLRKGAEKELSLVPMPGWEIEREFGSFSSATAEFSKRGAREKEKEPAHALRLAKRLEGQQAALERADAKIAALAKIACYIKSHMAEVDGLLAASREAGKKNIKL